MRQMSLGSYFKYLYKVASIQARTKLTDFSIVLEPSGMDLDDVGRMVCILLQQFPLSVLYNTLLIKITTHWCE